MDTATPRSPIAQALWVLGLTAIALLAFWFSVQRVRAGMIGWVNDDAQYATYARALIEGLGYVDTATDPPRVAQRFPIGFPGLLAIAAWGAGSTAELVLRMQMVGPLAVMALVGLAGWYLRSHGWPRWAALLGAGLIAVQPDVALAGSMVMSDVPAAALALAALIVFERCFRQEAPPALWAFGGLLLGLCLLFRYALAPLGLAVALLLLWQRRFKQGLASGAGLMLAFGPWLAYRLTAGGGEYGAQAGGLTSLEPGLFLKHMSTSVATFLTSGLPAFLGPHLLGGWSLTGVLVGTALAGVTLLGAIAWLCRPGAGQSPLGAIVLILSVALILVWQVRFINLGSWLMVRLMIPLAPLLLVAFVRGASEIASRLGGLRTGFAPAIAGALALVVVVNGGRIEAWRATHPEWRAWQFDEQDKTAATLAFVTERLPEGARLASFKSPLIHLHTGRLCAALSSEQTDREILAVLAAARAEYVVGLPLYADLGGQYVDVSAVILNGLAKAHPGLLRPVYLGHDKTTIVLRVDPAILAAAFAGSSGP